MTPIEAGVVQQEVLIAAEPETVFAFFTDPDKMIQWQGLSFHATGLWQSGRNLGGKIGTLANPSDLVSQHSTRLDSFWVQQLFLHKGQRICRGDGGHCHRQTNAAYQYQQSQ